MREWCDACGAPLRTKGPHGPDDLAWTLRYRSGRAPICRGCFEALYATPGRAVVANPGDWVLNSRGEWNEARLPSRGPSVAAETRGKALEAMP